MPEQTIAAIEAGGTKFVLALADSGGRILERTRIPTETPERTLSSARDFLQAAAQRHGPVAALGIASFGPLDTDPASPDYGRFAATPKPGWIGASYVEAFADLGVPLAIDTDVNGAALGEWASPANQGRSSVAYTTVGTGIGTGILRNGVPVQGFGAPETGHIRVPHDRSEDPFAGHCPFHGDCLEGLASGPAIAARWGEPLGSEAGLAKVGLIARYLAALASTLVLLHTPDRLIFGGGVMKAPGLIEALRKDTERLLAGYITHPRLDPGLVDYITLPSMGDDAGISGAIALGLRALERRR